MAPTLHYLQATASSLPREYATQFTDLVSSRPEHSSALENMFRFIAGGDCPDIDNASSETRLEWSTKQRAFREDLTRRGLTNKRAREEDVSITSHESKRPKLDSNNVPTDDPPKYALHSISVSSPIRKKVNITIHASSVRLTNPTTNAVESTVPLSSITRAFVLPTRGKQKPHWTVVLMAGDVPDRSKAAQGSPANQQIIFGLDAVNTAALTVTTFSSSAAPSSDIIAKSKETLPFLNKFLSYLPTPTLEPSTEVFRSALPNSAGREGGVPGVEAYLAAKPGTLWFLKEGILWGESKPCEFWAVQDLSEGDEGVRLISATGRNCTVVLSRKGEEEDDDSDSDDDDDDDESVETEFGMVDGREQEGIREWVRKYKRLFGMKVRSTVDVNGASGSGGGSGSGKKENGIKRDGRALREALPPDGNLPRDQVITADDDDDESDGSFEADSDDGGSASSSSSGSDDGSGDEEAEAEASGSEGDDEDGEGELRPENHPLMRPGAMPRISKAAINMVVEMVEHDLIGGGDELEDELED